MNVNPLLWHRTQIRIKTHTNYPCSFCSTFGAYSTFWSAPGSLWQWPKLSRVVCLSPRLSVCLHMHWIPGAVQVSRQRRTTCIMTTGEFPCGSRLHLLHSSWNRAKTWSPHLFWQPWTGERISVRMGKWVGLGWGGLCWGCIGALVQFPDAVDCWSESNGASFGFFHSRSWEIGCIYNSIMPFPPARQHTGIHPTTLKSHLKWELQNRPTQNVESRQLKMKRSHTICWV